MQTLAILLAGLFTAERRSQSVSEPSGARDRDVREGVARDPARVEH